MKNTKFILLILISIINFKAVIKDDSFNEWLDKFTIRAVTSDVSQQTVDLVMYTAIFLPTDIDYYRYYHECYDDTHT